MTDKQIIIDGVDVSGCENLMQGIVLFGCMEDRKTCSCINNPNCLYKQLKRKEQECEELKGKLKYIRNENMYLKESATDEQLDFVALNNYIKTLEFQLDQLKAENERLQKTQFCFAYEKDCHKVCKQQNCIIKNGYKAEQKLNKIKDRCNETLELMNKDSGTNTYAGGRCIEAENILQIIDEVE